MSKFLKGNYEVENKQNEKKEADTSNRLAEIFESSAAEKLGGSIAFVMKSNKFLWDEEDNA
jgi:hypothetical protein